MDIDRRKLLAAAPAFLACSAIAEAAFAASEAPPALQTYERETGGRIGVHAENIVTGAKIAWRADERFVMCSSFKASLAAHILKQVDRGQEHLDRMIPCTAADLLDYAPLARQNLAKGAMSVAEMCAGAVELSDNTCANLLLAQSGGPAALTAFWRETGDMVTRLDNNEPALNYHPVGDPQDTTTPAAMAATLRRLVLGDVLSLASRERLTGWMLNCKTGDNRLRGGLPKDWKIGDKTGNNGKDAAGDIAVVWPKPDTPIVIAAYVQGGTPTPERISAVYADIGRMVGARLG